MSSVFPGPNSAHVDVLTKVTVTALSCSNRHIVDALVLAFGFASADYCKRDFFGFNYGIFRVLLASLADLHRWS